MKRRSLFVTFEGIEGSGKTSQIVALARYLRRHDVSVVVTREPGGTRAGEEIRRIFLGPRGQGLSPWTELFLIEAARAQHLAEVIRPALAAGKVVLCDRFTDSTLAYQGYGRGLPHDVLRYLHRLGALSPSPELTLLFDLPVDEGLTRVTVRSAAIDPRARKRESRIDEESAAFHEKVRRGYLAIAGSQPRRVVRLSAGLNRAALRERVRTVVLARLGLDPALAGAVPTPPAPSRASKGEGGHGRPGGRG